MIKKISFENILTFDKKQFIEFNLKEQLNVIYGKNSAGKSNFLSVLNILQESITSGVKDIDRLVCKFTDSTIIFIEVLIYIGEEEYNYGFKFCAKESKYINEILKINDKFVFENNTGVISSELLSQEQVSILNKYDFKRNGVMKYLTELNSDDKVIKKTKNMKNYFQLEANSAEDFKYLANNEKLLQDVILEMKKIDVDIDDIIIRDNTNAMNEVREKMKENESFTEDFIDLLMSKNKYKIYFLHAGIDIPLEMESRGTQKYFKLLVGSFVGNHKYGEYIHIFDEIEMHFHDELLKRFFIFFNNKIKGQLICTTHNQVILEEKLLSKENILFVDKKHNSSEIYRLSSFEDIRTDKRHNWKNLYNADRFGAFPNIKN